MTNDANSTTAELFFAILASEVFLWDSFDAAFKQAGVGLTMARFVPLYHLRNAPMRLQELSACCNNKHDTGTEA